MELTLTLLSFFGFTHKTGSVHPEPEKTEFNKTEFKRASTAPSSPAGSVLLGKDNSSDAIYTLVDLQESLFTAVNACRYIGQMSSFTQDIRDFEHDSAIIKEIYDTVCKMISISSEKHEKDYVLYWSKIEECCETIAKKHDELRPESFYSSVSGPRSIMLCRFYLHCLKIFSQLSIEGEKELIQFRTAFAHNAVATQREKAFANYRNLQAMIDDNFKKRVRNEFQFYFDVIPKRLEKVDNKLKLLKEVSKNTNELEIALNGILTEIEEKLKQEGMDAKDKDFMHNVLRNDPVNFIILKEFLPPEQFKQLENKLKKSLNDHYEALEHYLENLSTSSSYSSP